MNNSLDAVEWKCFWINDKNIFKLRSAKSNLAVNKVNRKNGNGLFPHVTSSDKNNGIVDFIDEQMGYKVEANNVISIGVKTQTVFYQPYAFYTAISSLIISSERMNKYNALFIIALLKKQLSKFDWNTCSTLNRMQKQKIMLPVDVMGNPNWEFMEEYVKINLEHLVNKTINHLLGFNPPPSSEQLPKIIYNIENVKSWKALTIDDKTGILSIYSSNSGIDKNKIINLSSLGNIPYITRTKLNNGVNDFINVQNSIYELDGKNVITIGVDTQTIFYHPYLFYTGNNILILKHNNLNKYNGIFIVLLLKKQIEKFNWGNGATLSRVKNQKIILPVDEFGNPNWKFMEMYIKQEKSILVHKIINFYKDSLSINVLEKHEFK